VPAVDKKLNEDPGVTSGGGADGMLLKEETADDKEGPPKAAAIGPGAELAGATAIEPPTLLKKPGADDWNKNPPVGAQGVSPDGAEDVDATDPGAKLGVAAPGTEPNKAAPVGRPLLQGAPKVNPGTPIIPLLAMSAIVVGGSITAFPPVGALPKLPDPPVPFTKLGKVIPDPPLGPAPVAWDTAGCCAVLLKKNPALPSLPLPLLLLVPNLNIGPGKGAVVVVVVGNEGVDVAPTPEPPNTKLKPPVLGCLLFWSPLNPNDDETAEEDPGPFADGSRVLAAETTPKEPFPPAPKEFTGAIADGTAFWTPNVEVLLTLLF
jgi:hypothetical protein